MEEEQHWTRLIQRSDLGGLRAWLDGGGNLEEREPRTGNTALAYAANRGQLPVVRFLLERGADAAGSAAFLAAVIGGQGEIARLLLPLADDPDELRQAANLLACESPDEELLGLVKQRRKQLGRRK
jgi:hypothetical protein